MTDKKDWTGNSKTTFSQLGSSSHSETEREKHDFYATHPDALRLLLKHESFSNVWEPACGQGHLSEVLKQHNCHARSSDLIDRNYGTPDTDFLAIDNTHWNGDIITNPPFRYAQQFVTKALQITTPGNKIAMFLKIQFLEGKERKHLFLNHPPHTIYVSSSRIQCAPNGQFNDKQSSAVCYAWFIWINQYKGQTVIKWFN